MKTIDRSNSLKLAIWKNSQNVVYLFYTKNDNWGLIKTNIGPAYINPRQGQGYTNWYTVNLSGIHWYLTMTVSNGVLMEHDIFLVNPSFYLMYH